MTLLNETQELFHSGALTKSEYIKIMYDSHHTKLFDYAKRIALTDVASIRISDDKVIMTSKQYGVHMLCPEGDHRVALIEAINFGSYEKSDSDMIMSLMPLNGIFYDIGANMGWYSLICANKSKNLQIHAFEPIQKTYSMLKENIKLNDFKNICTHNIGFSDENKVLPFYFYPEGSCNASSANLSEREDAEIINCNVERLDDFMKKNKLTVDFIKCDVEGAELLVFQGGIESIEMNKPIVFTEILRKWTAKFNYNPNDIFDLFKKIGYSAFTVNRKHLSKFSVMDELTTETNFYLLHNEKHKSLIDLYAQ